MSQLIVAADTHGHFGLLERMIARELEADPGTSAVLHAGDIGLYDEHSLGRLRVRERQLIEKHGNPIHLAYDRLSGERSLPLPLVGIPGNHEDFALVERLEAGELRLPWLHLLTPGAAAELTLGARKVRVAGLGRIAPSLEAKKIKRAKKHILREHLRTMLEGLRGAPSDVLLLHDPPELRVEGQRGGFGSLWLTELVRQLRPGLVLCGHMHFEYRAELDGIPIVGVGYGAKGRYGVLDEELRFHFRDLDGRQAAPRRVAPASLLRRGRCYRDSGRA
jgi:Icc-related predicted phosphoesterase